MALRLTIHPPRSAQSFSLAVDQAPVKLGRSSRCELRLPFRIVSGHHLTITDGADGYRVRDEHSTNGTMLDGEVLPSGQDVALEPGSTLEIVDLRIDVEWAAAVEGDLTLDATGTMVRQMVSDVLSQDAPADDAEHAYLEVLDGPHRGSRAIVPDLLEQAPLGGGADSLIELGSDLPAEVVVLERCGDGFGVRPGDDAARAGVALAVGGQPLEALRELSSGDELTIGDQVIGFFDPLEAYLDELDGIVAPAADADDAADADADSTGGDDATGDDTPAGDGGASASVTPGTEGDDAPDDEPAASAEAAGAPQAREAAEETAEELEASAAADNTRKSPGLGLTELLLLLLGVGLLAGAIYVVVLFLG